jgi:hypothetical protein
LGSIPTSCRPPSRSSTNTSTCSGRAGSPPIVPATQRCGGTPNLGLIGSGRSKEATVPAARAAPPRRRRAGCRRSREARRPGPAFRHRPHRKTDAHDAHAVAVVAVRTKTLRVLQLDGELEALRMLTDRREALTRRRVQTVDRRFLRRSATARSTSTQSSLAWAPAVRSRWTPSCRVAPSTRPPGTPLVVREVAGPGLPDGGPQRVGRPHGEVTRSCP